MTYFTEKAVKKQGKSVCSGVSGKRSFFLRHLVKTHLFHATVTLAVTLSHSEPIASVQPLRLGVYLTLALAFRLPPTCSVKILVRPKDLVCCHVVDIKERDNVTPYQEILGMVGVVRLKVHGSGCVIALFRVGSGYWVHALQRTLVVHYC